MLDIDIFFRGEVLVVRLFGRLTKDNYSKLKKEVFHLFNDASIFNLIINIQNLSCIDYYGMKTIRRIYKMCDNSLLCVNPKQLNMVEDFNTITDEGGAINKINI